jgi:hypothetical protein
VASVLFVWELGAGLGHIMRLAPLANHVLAQEHRVFAALREIRGAHGAFDPGVRLLPAPHGAGAAVTPPPTDCFADILRDVTFGDERTLATHVAAWRTIYELVRPDLIVFDHSPTALLAARGFAARRVVTGTGFTVPCDLYPLPSLRPWREVSESHLRAQEDQVLRAANRILETVNEPALQRLGQLYSESDDTLLTTFAELDPYSGPRPKSTEYLGMVGSSGGGAPQWPVGAGKKVFAYLRPFPALGDVLRFLNERHVPTIAYIEGVAGPWAERFASATLRLEEERLDVSVVGRECDLAILNGNGGTTAAMLLAGRPSLQIPINLEHALNARAVERMGAGLSVGTRDGGAIVKKLEALIDSDNFRRGARGFAERYASFDAARLRERMCERIDAVLAA